MTDYLIGLGWNYIGKTGGCSCSGGGKLRYTHTNRSGYEIRISGENFEIRKNNIATNTGRGKTALEQIYAQVFPAA